MGKPTRLVTLAVILIVVTAWLMPVSVSAQNARAAVPHGAATSIQQSAGAIAPQSTLEGDTNSVTPLGDLLAQGKGKNPGPPPESGGKGSDQGKGGGKGQEGGGNCPTPPCPKQ